jgi:hypothetical protein
MDQLGPAQHRERSRSEFFEPKTELVDLSMADDLFARVAVMSQRAVDCGFRSLSFER